MTRDKFINEVTTFDYLVFFCDTNGLGHIVEDIRNGEDYENYLDQSFENMIREDGWREARDQMNDVDNDGYDWYEISYGDWIVINEDDNLDEYKDQVIEAMDRAEAWDEPEEPDQEPDPEEEDDEYLDICPQEIDADGLMAENSGFLAMISEKESERVSDNDESDDVEYSDGDEESVPHADLSELIATSA